jgi:hypothetical protein
LKSKPLVPHPLFVSFIKAAHEHRLQDEVGETKTEKDIVMQGIGD